MPIPYPSILYLCLQISSIMHPMPPDNVPRRDWHNSHFSLRFLVHPQYPSVPFLLHHDGLYTPPTEIHRSCPIRPAVHYGRLTASGFCRLVVLMIFERGEGGRRG